MKNINFIITFIFIFILAIPAKSQDSKDTTDNSETLLGNKEFFIGAYAGPELKFTQFNGELGLAYGGKGGVIINGRLSVGGGGYSIASSHKVGDILSGYAYINTNYGGFILEYIDKYKSMIHYKADLLIGWGEASYKPVGSNNQQWMNESSTYFVFEPGFDIEANIIKFVKVDVGVSYRLASGLQLSRTNNSDIGGFTVNMGVRFAVDDVRQLYKYFVNE